ncbi:hypothetical protein CLAFUW4_03182 [Fulvia fulva]|uniref:Uncharacterized protein n=1 Tax=Passalora fulva TaxID=5499 RepID=A0A9Q8L920_PASFU|nr:uncharacterized protein CLAFUR5_03166 [Fulvia fulva]KAK4632404.1 hypothetical protein CLAFUR4_03171 [Fulvia fulva]KAK4632432.1 hypothetical protein CLAFUR0_03175 [Fulvia fulva]UJO13087.1 hypothetical protein CLAFUR5_03166 [Fulvia fulva]WPV11345.1 hypothetical protein CLAFUW4_03182 [Fulvia fulva]WPV26074.1 hypothetical protein CLAFUW7_03175 [Fulvia fulva]
MDAAGLGEACRPSTSTSPTCYQQQHDRLIHRVVIVISISSTSVVSNFNIIAQLKRFQDSSAGPAIHNGGAEDKGLLNEEWEFIALLQANKNIFGQDFQDEYYLLSLSDNDFMIRMDI